MSYEMLTRPVELNMPSLMQLPLGRRRYIKKEALPSAFSALM